MQEDIGPSVSAGDHHASLGDKDRRRFEALYQQQYQAGFCRSENNTWKERYRVLEDQAQKEVDAHEQTKSLLKSKTRDLDRVTREKEVLEQVLVYRHHEQALAAAMGGTRVLDKDIAGSPMLMDDVPAFAIPDSR